MFTQEDELMFAKRGITEAQVIEQLESFTPVCLSKLGKVIQVLYGSYGCISIFLGNRRTKRKADFILFTNDDKITLLGLSFR